MENKRNGEEWKKWLKKKKRQKDQETEKCKSVEMCLGINNISPKRSKTYIMPHIWWEYKNLIIMTRFVQETHESFSFCYTKITKVNINFVQTSLKSNMPVSIASKQMSLV